MVVMMVMEYYIHKLYLLLKWLRYVLLILRCFLAKSGGRERIWDIFSSLTIVEIFLLSLLSLFIYGSEPGVVWAGMLVLIRWLTCTNCGRYQRGRRSIK